MKDVLEAFPFLRAQPQEQIQQYRGEHTFPQGDPSWAFDVPQILRPREGKL